MLFTFLQAIFINNSSRHIYLVFGGLEAARGCLNRTHPYEDVSNKVVFYLWEVEKKTNKQKKHKTQEMLVP